MKSTQGTEGEKGIGLGLVICHDFIEMYGGTTEVESKIDEGSVFSFTIPNQLDNVA